MLTPGELGAGRQNQSSSTFVNFYFVFGDFVPVQAVVTKGEMS